MPSLKTVRTISGFPTKARIAQSKHVNEAKAPEAEPPFRAAASAILGGRGKFYIQRKGLRRYN